ncbi:MAG: response regulator transcription factor [Anaerolineaceae bacterium]|jgi:two-component system response regulator MprA
MNERILIIEDDEAIVKTLRRALAYEGYQVDAAIDGETGLMAARDHTPDLVILDWMLPGIDGLEVCQRLRSGDNVPILILTAKDSTQDRVQGLDAGADDYMVKPYELEELLARVRALLRRTQQDRAPILAFADLTLDTSTRQATRKNRVINLTAKEYDLLELFLRHPRQVLTREMIFDRVWGYDFGGESNVLDVYIRYLRMKLESGGEARLIFTVRSVGYVLREKN